LLINNAGWLQLKQACPASHGAYPGVAPQPQLLEFYDEAADKQAALAIDVNVKAAFMILRSVVLVHQIVCQDCCSELEPHVWHPTQVGDDSVCLEHWYR
jgi:NAD(P)-dependent dehydrogenase (short-subunit alcohol dehydrogenase family)